MKIPYTASARLAKLIGKENFSNAEGAIVELIKNSYDADSSFSYVVFSEEEQKPVIYIIDSGCGMDLTTIKEKWMKFATDDKLYNYRSIAGRIKSGAKGIGRFALNRLGNKSEMLTFTLSGEALRWSMNWDDFDIPQADLSEVVADVDYVDITSIQNEIENILSPYIPDFDGSAITHGTLLKIAELNDLWSDKKQEALYDNLSYLIPPYAKDVFRIGLFSSNKPDQFGLVDFSEAVDYDYYVKSSYREGTLHVEMHRNELNVSLLEKSYKSIFLREDMQKPRYSLQTFIDGVFSTDIKLSELKLDDKETLNKYEHLLGDFAFEFYFMKNTYGDNTGESDKRKFPYRSIRKGRKIWLEQNAGVKIFRDGFRVRPYGEKGQDWLQLGERQATSPGGAGQRPSGYRIRPNQISGAVSISRINNPALEDKSGREGLQESAVFDLFKDVLIGIINLFEIDRNTIMYALADEFKKKNETDIDKANAVSSKRQKDLTDQDAKSLQKGFVAQQQLIEYMSQEMDLLRNLASTGIVVASSAHELSNIEGILSSRGNLLLERMEKVFNREDTARLVSNKYKNPFFLVETLINDDQKIKGWLNFALTSVKKEKRETSVVNLKTYLQDYTEKWRPILSPSNIRIKLDDNFPESAINIAAIDLDSLFNNFLSNSVYAIQQLKSRERRDIFISGTEGDSSVTISFVDNGIGLTKEYQSHPYDIFNPFETSKCDNYGKKIGTGLGLYIVKGIIEKYKGAEVQILDNIKEGFGISVTFNSIGDEI